MSFHGFDPGDRNNWYQSPQLGLFPVSPAGYGGGISAACYLTHSSHPHGSPSYAPRPSQFPLQPSYPPPPPFPFQPSYSPSPPPPSQTIINGYVFPHQFPCVSQTHAQFRSPPQLQPIYPTAQQPLTTTSHNPLIPPSNPNPWIYPPISQSHSCDPHSQFVSTKPMTTTPIYHSAPSPPVCEKPHSPPQGSGKLQVHKQQTEAKLCEMRESLKSSMDTFISEFREELRLLRGSLQSPTSQDDNPLKFGSPPPSSTPQLIPAATEASSSLIPTDNGIIRKTHVDNDLNLSHTDVILGFYDNTSMDHIVVGTAITSTAALVGGEKDWNYNGSQESGNHSRKGPAGENLEANPIATIQSADRYENQIYRAAKLDKDDDASDYEKGVIEKCNKIGDAGYNEEVETSNLCGDDKSKGATENFSTDHVSNLESVSCLSELQVKSETCNLCGNEEKYMFVTAGNLCRALVFKCCPISIVKVPEKWFLDAMNMTLDIMIGKIKCSVEKELLENFHENHLKLDEKCLGYVMSTLDALYTMQKLGFKFDCQNLYQLLSSLSKLEGDLEDLDMIRNINWEENAKKLNFVLREGLKLDNKMAVCFTESQSRSHLLKWFILCFELCHCETKLFCKEAFDGLDELTQNSLSRLISTLRISPELHSVVFIPDTKVNLAITGAICFLKVVVNDSQVVEVIQRPTDLQCSQLLLSPKGLGTALVTDYDIGIASPLASSDVVQVAEIAWIKIMSLEVISLMEGHAQTIDMMAGISGDRTFDSYQFAYNSAQVQVKDQIIEMSNTGGGNINVPEVKIFASHLGITTFFVNALQQFGHEILSQPIMMEVYAGPEIHLHDIFLVPGASYVLTLQGTPGAPTFGVNVEFTSLELLQHEYHIDPIDVEAVIAITIVQLYSKEAALIYKKLNMMTRSAYEFVEMWRKGVESDQIPCLQALEVILVECSAALDPWMFVVVSKVLMFTTYGIKDVRASHLSCMRNINAPDQFVKPIRSTANGKAMMELNMGLYTDIGLHDFSLDSQSPTLGFELLFAKMRFRKVLCMKLYMVAKDMVASGATTQGHMLHDKVIEFSSQLNQANSCTALGKYGHAEMKRLEQEINIEKCVALAIIPMGNTDWVSEEIEQPLFLNVIFQVLDFSAYSDNNLAILFDDVPIVGMLKTGAIDWLLIVPCLLTNGDSTPTVITWLSKLKAHSQSSSMYSSPLGNFPTATMELLSHIVLEECEWVVFKSVKNCYDDKPGEWGQFTRVVNVDTGQLSHHVEAKAYVLKATQLTNLEENDDLFLYFQHWGITLLIFYFEFVYDLFIYACFFYNNLGAAFDNTMALQRVNIVDYALGTSLNASDRYWDKMFLMLAISTVLEPQMPKITFGDLDNEAWTNFGRLFRLEVKPVL